MKVKFELKSCGRYGDAFFIIAKLQNKCLVSKAFHGLDATAMQYTIRQLESHQFKNASDLLANDKHGGFNWSISPEWNAYMK